MSVRPQRVTAPDRLRFAQTLWALSLATASLALKGMVWSVSISTNAWRLCHPVANLPLAQTVREHTDVFATPGSKVTVIIASMLTSARPVPITATRIWLPVPTPLARLPAHVIPDTAEAGQSVPTSTNALFPEAAVRTRTAQIAPVLSSAPATWATPEMV